MRRLGITIGFDAGLIRGTLLVPFAWSAVWYLFVGAQGAAGIHNAFHLKTGFRFGAVVRARWIQRCVGALEVRTGDGADPFVRDGAV